MPDQLETSSSASLENELIQLIADLRAEARTRKDWSAADAIRDRLAEVGVLIEDRPEGTTWRLKP
jgi:cysteinyl-tRNA synthetase